MAKFPSYKHTKHLAFPSNNGQCSTFSKGSLNVSVVWVDTLIYDLSGGISTISIDWLIGRIGFLSNSYANWIRYYFKLLLLPIILNVLFIIVSIINGNNVYIYEPSYVPNI